MTVFIKLLVMEKNGQWGAGGRISPGGSKIF